MVAMLASMTIKYEISDDDKPMSPCEVAAVFRVDPKTVTRWAKAGLLESFRTPGGHRRYRPRDVEELMNRSQAE
jgi:excisionase family DNA binding protein